MWWLAAWAGGGETQAGPCDGRPLVALQTCRVGPVLTSTPGTALGLLGTPGTVVTLLGCTEPAFPPWRFPTPPDRPPAEEPLDVKGAIVAATLSDPGGVREHVRADPNGELTLQYRWGGSATDTYPALDARTVRVRPDRLRVYDRVALSMIEHRTSPVAEIACLP